MLAVVFLSCTAAVGAEEFEPVTVEVGASYAAGRRQTDRFSRGMEKYRSTLSVTTANVVDADDFGPLSSAEFFLRLGDLFGERGHHQIGLVGGSFDIPTIRIRELRSDARGSTLDWRFRVQYLLFTYHYSDVMPWRLLRRWRWELGGGFGFAPSARWTSKGYLYGPGQLASLDVNQSSGSGNALRFELGVSRALGEYSFIRLSTSMTYVYLGDWTGRINSADGQWFYLRNGGLFALSAANFSLTPTLILDEQLGLTQGLLADRKADVPIGALEVRISTGVRF